MGDEQIIAEAEAPATSARKNRLRSWILGALVAAAALLALGFAIINSPIGKRLIADQIAQVAPVSGLRFEVGRIEGDIFGRAVLHDVTLYDPKGKFLTIPEVDLDWRPLNWIWAGLDVRNLTAKRGTLLRVPDLLPGDPDAPILPDFDIRIDRFEIDRLKIAEGIVPGQSPMVDLLAKADIRSGRVYLTAKGDLGDRDKLSALIDAEPDGDRFDLDLDYRAPTGGVLASLLNSNASYTARIIGDGSWTNWDGALVATRSNGRLAAFTLTNKAGQYSVLGQAYPDALLSGLAANAVGKALSVAATGTLLDSVVEGKVKLLGRAFVSSGQGSIDLANNSFGNFNIAASLSDPRIFGDSVRLDGARLTATLGGAFRDLTIDHRVVVDTLTAGGTSLSALVQQGTATFDGTRWLVPVDAQVAKLVTGNALVDPRLGSGTLRGAFVFAGSKVLSDDLKLAFRDASAQLVLRGDTKAGAYAFVGPVQLRGLPLENIGTASGSGTINLVVGSSIPWTMKADFAARIHDVTNATIANLAGPEIRMAGGVSLGAVQPLDFRNILVTSQKLTLGLNGKISNGTTSLAGRGNQADYGDFTVEASFDGSGPNAVLVFASPLPSAGLKDVRVAIAPSVDGFRINTQGQSLLGEFNGLLNLVAPAEGPTRIAIDTFNVWKTSFTGNLTLTDGGADGGLLLSGGGLDGRIGLATRQGGQGFLVNLTANNAGFGGAQTVSIARAEVEASGYLKDGNSSIKGNATAQGLRFGSLFVGRMAAQAELQNGRGTATASLAGRRGSRFNLQANASFAPERIAVAAQGNLAGQTISMPRRAVFIAQPGGGWRLERTQISYGGGATLVSGEFGAGTTALDLALQKMPLSLIDVAVADLGLGGTISGKVDFRAGRSAVPTGNARVKIDGLTRSGLVLTSSPIDVALVSNLSANALEARAVFDENGQRRGRLQARISSLADTGALVERLSSGDLFAQLRYNGPADALWRLSGVEGFDLTGPLSAAANVTGTFSNPSVRGSVSSDDLRVRSSLSGTDVRKVSVRGNFAGSRLTLSRFSGVTGNGGTVSGSGTVDLDNLTQRGPGLDIKIAAQNADLLNANGLAASVTGPLRIVSDGQQGTIAGRVSINRASWRLGSAVDTAAQLPEIKTRDINLAADIGPARVARVPWRYLIDAKARSRVDVDGLGLESEWSADIQLRGSTADPRIGGTAQVVRGDYSFAGTRFELTRGRINFDVNAPIDPRLDIVAETQRDGLDVIVRVQGNALQPEITFSSNPLLPEEEILARLLFGGSITTLSATDALQLGTALASLRGGAGLDPINKLRTAIGLDRLRIISADAALNRGTGIAIGKNIGRKFYVEIVTDGRGYSATETEFRITRWLSLLASVSTIGRESVRAEVSRDY